MSDPARLDDEVPGDSTPIRELDAPDESALVAQVRLGDEAAFERMFRRYYNPLCVFVNGYVRDKELAEELVEAVFARIWQQRERWEVRVKLTAYLYAAARYQVLDHRRHAAVERRMRDRSLHEESSPAQGRVADQHDECEASELDLAIRDAVAQLPERCRLIFTLRWQHHLSYADIAQTLEISTKTVEAQITRALKTLRARLQPYR